mgnify:FL=1|tara:strand:- start:8853 stop:9068 length:216 start_codon:yes stop_codon:yes gene_type:complete
MEEQQLAEALNTINECLKTIGTRLDNLEKYVQELPTPDKTYYKPDDKDDYMNLKDNMDHIYYRLKKLEHGM